MTNFVDKVEALKKKAEKATPGEWEAQDGCSWRRIGVVGRDGNVLRPTNNPYDHHPDLAIKEEDFQFIAAASPDFILELCDKALEAERLLREMTADRDLWQQAHDEDCPNKALVETLEAEIARLKGDR